MSEAWPRLQPPAKPEAIAQLQAECGLKLPQEYLDFLRRSNGADGPLGIQPCWLVIWPAEDVLESNQEIRLAEYVPGFFGFGSNGAGELLAFDTRGPHPWPILRFDYVVLEEDNGLLVVDSFNALLEVLFSQEGNECGD